MSISDNFKLIDVIPRNITTYSSDYTAESQVFAVNVGSLRGEVVFSFNSYDLPDRYIVVWNDATVIDTGYRGDTTYDLQLLEKDLDVVSGTGEGSASFVKTAEYPELMYVKVVSPFSDTRRWETTTTFRSLDESLYLAGQDLSIVDVTDYPLLVYLDISNNNLTLIDVTKNSKLTYFYCNNNNLLSLNILENPMLQELYCHTNQLIELDVSENDGLYKLICNSNQISTLDVSNLSLLNTLNFASNSISSIDITNNPNLNTLIAYGNNITTLNLVSSSNLTELNLNDNYLTSGSINTILTSLDSYGNSNGYAFLGGYNNSYPTLVGLESYNNLIAKGWNIQINGYSIDFSVTPSDNIIDMGAAAITSANLSSNVDIQYLYISSNTLSDLDISNNINLVRLDCSYNNLSILDCSLNVNLTELDSSNNLLTAIDLTGLTQLSTLLLNDNLLASIDISSNTGLQLLNLANNELTSLSIGTNSLLIGIDVSNNNLDATSVDGIFTYIDSISTGDSGSPGFGYGYIFVDGGTNAAPTVSSAAARTALSLRGWHIITN